MSGIGMWGTQHVQVHNAGNSTSMWCEPGNHAAFPPPRAVFRMQAWRALSLRPPLGSNSQRSRELKQQTHFDVRSAIFFVGVIFVSLGGLFYIRSKLLLVPLNVSVLFGVLRRGEGWGFTSSKGAAFLWTRESCPWRWRIRCVPLTWEAVSPSGGFCAVPILYSLVLKLYSTSSRLQVRSECVSSTPLSGIKYSASPALFLSWWMEALCESNWAGLRLSGDHINTIIDLQSRLVLYLRPSWNCTR